MTDETSWGKPNHVNRTVTAGGVREQWSTLANNTSISKTIGSAGSTPTNRRAMKRTVTVPFLEQR